MGGQLAAGEKFRDTQSKSGQSSSPVGELR